MRWEVETWRKLYTRVSAEWAKLPALARGLGSELLKYADDEGRIPLGSGETPADTVVRVVAAHKSELRQVRACVADLLEDGYLVAEPDAVVIRNLPAAQERLSHAARQARYRARLNGTDVPLATRGPVPAPRTSTETSRETSRKRQHERHEVTSRKRDHSEIEIEIEKDPDLPARAHEGARAQVPGPPPRAPATYANARRTAPRNGATTAPLAALVAGVCQLPSGLERHTAGPTLPSSQAPPSGVEATTEDPAAEDLDPLEDAGE